MFNKKYGYTLSEILVTLAILGVLISVMLPTIVRVNPNKQKALFKKAYYVAERIVYELVNDDDVYPIAPGTSGFDNVGEVTYLGISYGSDTDAALQKSKFCKLFARKVNTISDEANCDSAHTSYYNPAFYTTDGIAWSMPYTLFPSNTQQIIRVDVNGATKPNCVYNSKCPNPDRFEIYVSVDGKMSVEGVKEKEYLKSNSSMR